jgi:hypothetical protein
MLHEVEPSWCCMQVPGFGIVSEANCEQLMKVLHIPANAVPTDLDHTLNRTAQV